MIADGQKIILFGASETNYADCVIREYGEQIIYCIDNDEKKHGSVYSTAGKEYVIYPVKRILEEQRGTFMVVTVATYWFNELAAQLLSMGLERDKDFIFAGDLLSSDVLENYWNSHKTHNNPPPPVLRVLHLEYSGYCNLECIYCPYHGVHGIYKEHRGFMSFDTLKVIVEKCKHISTITTLDLCGHGEIFLNKNWYEFTDLILNEMPIEMLAIYTNGMLLTKENAKKLAQLKEKCGRLSLVISIDGRSPEENDSFRLNSDYQTIKTNVFNALQFLDRDDIAIANVRLMAESQLEMKHHKILRHISAPDFILEDFSNFRTYSRPISNRTPNNIFRLCDADCYNSEVKLIGEDFLCSMLFGVCSINNSGQILKCTCSTSKNLFCGNVFDDDPEDVFYHHKSFERARDIFSKGITPGFCSTCSDNPEKRYFILTKKD